MCHFPLDFEGTYHGWTYFVSRGLKQMEVVPMIPVSLHRVGLDSRRIALPKAVICFVYVGQVTFGAFCFSTEPLKIKLLAGEQKATELNLLALHLSPWKYQL